MSLMLYFANATAGVRLTHGVVDGRDLKLKSNTLSLHEDTVLDVPAASAAAMRTQTGGSSSSSNNSSAYCATLGHKVNHSSAPNARYDVFDHPLHGCIKGVRDCRTFPRCKKSRLIMVSMASMGTQTGGSSSCSSSSSSRAVQWLSPHRRDTLL